MKNDDSPKYYLAPAFLSDFACTGTECKSNCCISAWRILIDKASFTKYHALPDSDPMKLRVQRNVKRISKEEGANDLMYAEIKHADKYGRCPFLDEKNLCDIQKCYGQEMLCKTCRWYPRIAYAADTQLYMGCVQSCPEVARLALLQRDGIEFAYREIKDTQMPMQTLFTRASAVYTNGYAKYFKELQFFVITLLQDRNYKLWERLTICGSGLPYTVCS